MLGAVIVRPLLELLRDASDARVIFYLLLAPGSASRSGCRGSFGVVAGAQIAFGFVVHAIAGAIRRLVDRRRAPGGGGVVDALGRSFPCTSPRGSRRSSYIGLIAAALGLTLLRGWLRTWRSSRCSTWPRSCGRT